MQAGSVRLSVLLKSRVSFGFSLVWPTQKTRGICDTYVEAAGAALCNEASALTIGEKEEIW